MSTAAVARPRALRLKFGPLLALLLTLRCCACEGGTYVDADEDGYPSTESTGPCVGWDTGFDCDDADPTVHPGAEEIPGDGIDQNCDGRDDEVVGAEAGVPG